MSANKLAKLAVFYDEQSFSMYDLAEAARGFCELIWVVRADRFDAMYVRLLERMGTVFDVSGLDDRELDLRLRELGVEGIAAYSDGTLRRAATAAVAIGLPFHLPEVAARLRDKSLQRQAFAGHGVPGPAFELLTSGASTEEVAGAVRRMTLPAVIKPTQGASSRDMVVVHTAGELREQLSTRAEDVLVEQYLLDPPQSSVVTSGRATAHFVSVESVVVESVIRHLFISGRFPLVDPLRESGGFMPSDLPAAVADDVQQMAAAGAKALGVTHGFLHTEVKLTPDGPRIVEINGRIGGGIPGLVAMTGGPDLLRWSFMLALGLTLPTRVPPRRGVGFWLWEQAPTWARSVKTLAGMGDVAAIAGVRNVATRLAPGDAVDWREGGQSYIYRVEGWVPDHDTLWVRRREIMDTAEVSYEHGPAES